MFVVLTGLEFSYARTRPPRKYRRFSDYKNLIVYDQSSISDWDNLGRIEAAIERTLLFNHKIIFFSFFGNHRNKPSSFFRFLINKVCVFCIWEIKGMKEFKQKSRISGLDGWEWEGTRLQMCDKCWKAWF